MVLSRYSFSHIPVFALRLGLAVIWLVLVAPPACLADPRLIDTITYDDTLSTVYWNGALLSSPITIACDGRVRLVNGMPDPRPDTAATTPALLPTANAIPYARKLIAEGFTPREALNEYGCALLRMDVACARASATSPDTTFSARRSRALAVLDTQLVMMPLVWRCDARTCQVLLKSGKYWRVDLATIAPPDRDPCAAPGDSTVMAGALRLAEALRARLTRPVDQVIILVSGGMYMYTGSEATAARAAIRTALSMTGDSTPSALQRSFEVRGLPAPHVPWRVLSSIVLQHRRARR